MIRILMYGAGVNSTPLLLAATTRNIDRPDAVVYVDSGADTCYTRSAALLGQDLCEKARLPFFRVEAPSVYEATAATAEARRIPDAAAFYTIPLHTIAPDGRRGRLQRRCTRYHRIRPIDHFVRRFFSLPLRGIYGHQTLVEYWLGFTTDEARRAQQPPVKWKRHRFPLLEAGISRHQCRQILDDHGMPHVIRSACSICPLRNNADWHAMAAHDPVAWRAAKALDDNIRRSSITGHRLYLHHSCRSLRHAVENCPPPPDAIRGT